MCVCGGGEGGGRGLGLLNRQNLIGNDKSYLLTILKYVLRGGKSMLNLLKEAKN